MAKWNILLDFDRTIAEGHSGGVDFSENSPMGEANKIAFETYLQKWLAAGHNVAIITRGIDVKIGHYFKWILKIPITLKGFKPGKLSIFAPTAETFYAHPEDEFWAVEKTKYVQSFLEKSGTNNPFGISHTIFMDDTQLNMDEMWKKYPWNPTRMICHTAVPGKYKVTFNFVDSVVGEMTGGKTRKRRRTNKKTRRKRRR
jgi:hypothetical protein